MTEWNFHSILVLHPQLYRPKQVDLERSFMQCSHNHMREAQHMFFGFLFPRRCQNPERTQKL